MFVVVVDVAIGIQRRQDMFGCPKGGALLIDNNSNGEADDVDVGIIQSSCGGREHLVCYFARESGQSP